MLPCALLLRESEGAWQLSAADPAGGVGTLALALCRAGGAVRNVLLTLPDGPRVGASLTVPVE